MEAYTFYLTTGIKIKMCQITPQRRYALILNLLLNMCPLAPKTKCSNLPYCMCIKVKLYQIITHKKYIKLSYVTKLVM